MQAVAYDNLKDFPEIVTPAQAASLTKQLQHTTWCSIRNAYVVFNGSLLPDGVSSQSLNISSKLCSEFSKGTVGSVNAVDSVTDSLSYRNRT